MKQWHSEILSKTLCDCKAKKIANAGSLTIMEILREKELGFSMITLAPELLQKPSRIELINLA